MPRKAPQAIRITSATRSRADDISARQRRYVISMGIRAACFLGAVVVALNGGNGWLLWVLIAASCVLPYVAVVMANAGASSDSGGPGFLEPDPSRRALPPASD